MEKEMVQKFDLEAAFKALDEIEAPKTKGLKANRIDLKERFAAKTYGDALVEDYYNINDHEALEEAKEDREEEIAKAKLARIEKIVDLDAESPDDLLPSYVGKVIIQCPQCMTLFYKNPEDIEKSEENPDVVNINEICQHCGNASGYTLIGKVDAVSEDEAANYEAAEEGTEEDELNLDFGEPTEEVSPEGTGGGFEEEEIAIEEGSEDSSDDELDLEAIDLEPTEESLKHKQLNEDIEKVVYQQVRAYETKDNFDNRSYDLCEIDDDGTYFDKLVNSGNYYAVVLGDFSCEYGDDGNGNYQWDEEHDDHFVPTKVWPNGLNVSHLTEAKEENLNEDVEDVKVEVEAEEILDAAAKAGKEVAKEVEADLTKAEVKKITDKIVTKELELPVIEEGSDDSSDDELKEALSPSEVAAKLDAYAASLGVDEGYKGTPEERTTHLEYTDDNPADGKAVLPDNIEKQLTECEECKEGECEKPLEECGENCEKTLKEDECKDCDCKDGVCECSDKNATETPLAEGKYDVSDAEFKSMLQDKVFQEFGEALTEDNETLGKLPTESEVKDITDKLDAVGEEIKAEAKAEEKDKEVKAEESLKEKCEDLDEESLNKHISDYLTEVYANVKDFAATDCSFKGNTLVVEGAINFNSGKTRTTKFEFTESKKGELGRVTLEGYNKDLAEDAHFTLNCLLEDSGKCLITEGFGYKYTINNTLVEGLK